MKEETEGTVVCNAHPGKKKSGLGEALEAMADTTGWPIARRPWVKGSRHPPS